MALYEHDGAYSISFKGQELNAFEGFGLGAFTWETRCRAIRAVRKLLKAGGRPAYEIYLADV